MTKQVAIDVKNLTVGYGDYVLLHDANYEVIFLLLWAAAAAVRVVCCAY